MLARQGFLCGRMFTIIYQLVVLAPPPPPADSTIAHALARPRRGPRSWTDGQDSRYHRNGRTN